MEKCIGNSFRNVVEWKFVFVFLISDKSMHLPSKWKFGCWCWRMQGNESCSHREDFVSIQNRNSNEKLMKSDLCNPAFSWIALNKFRATFLLSTMRIAKERKKKREMSENSKKRKIVKKCQANFHRCGRIDVNKKIIFFPSSRKYIWYVETESFVDVVAFFFCSFCRN